MKKCCESEEKATDACNESSSPFAQAAMAALAAIMPMLMQSQGQKLDCNKASDAQKAAAQQMGQSMCQPPGGGGQPGGGQNGQNGQNGNGNQNGGNNMAKDCKSKADSGKSACGEAKKAASKKKSECKPSEPDCKADAEKAEKAAEGGEKHNDKMGSMNVGQIMQMLGQLLCQAAKSDQCQKDACSAPGQLKFNPGDSKMTTLQPGQTKILTDDEGCVVDCNNLNYVDDPQYPEWAAKVNARIAKFKPMCECQKTPGLPGCGQQSTTTAVAPSAKKDKKDSKLTSDAPSKGNSSDKTAGSLSGAGGKSGGFGGGGGSGLGGAGGKASDAPKNPNGKAAPPGGPAVNSGYEGGGGGGAKSGGSGNDPEGGLGKYSKYLPGKKPASDVPAGLQITGAGGKSIWEKISEAYRDKGSSLNR